MIIKQGILRFGTGDVLTTPGEDVTAWEFVPDDGEGEEQ